MLAGVMLKTKGVKIKERHDDRNPKLEIFKRGL
jgi:hypothetical protein